MQTFHPQKTPRSVILTRLELTLSSAVGINQPCLTCYSAGVYFTFPTPAGSHKHSEGGEVLSYLYSPHSFCFCLCLNSVWLTALDGLVGVLRAWGFHARAFVFISSLLSPASPGTHLASPTCVFPHASSQTSLFHYATDARPCSTVCRLPVHVHYTVKGKVKIYARLHYWHGANIKVKGTLGHCVRLLIDVFILLFAPSHTTLRFMYRLSRLCCLHKVSP